MLYLGIFLLAGIGALLRFGLDQVPFGILVANVAGSAAMGFLMAHPQWMSSISPHSQKVLMVGLLGALTTFSGFSAQVVGSFEAGQLVKAGGIILAHNLLAISACFAVYRLSV